jgi:hypothetical protein
VAVPISIAWFAMSIWLGRRQAVMADRQAGPDAVAQTAAPA